MPISSAAKAQAGFSLLEMLLALSLLALAAGLAAPRLGVLPASRLVMADADAATALLRRARLAAVAGNRMVSVVFDVEARSIAADGQTVRLNRSHIWTLRTGAALRPADGHGRMIFYPDGSASGGQLRIAHDARAALVRVDWLSGRIEASDG